jgi:hypothetical protein
LLWNYGAAGVINIDSVEVRVFATEMVYVAEGNYCLGDGNGSARSLNSFQLKSPQNNYALITDGWSHLINTGGLYSSGSVDDNTVTNDGIRISGIGGLDMNDDKVADYPNFPTGYKGFYCMKYKVTQGQYTDFLNTVCASDTTASVMNDVQNPVNPYALKSIPKQLQAVWRFLEFFYNGGPDPNDTKRHSITFDSLQSRFIVSRPDRAYAQMDMNKALSFSEWSGLRPMSELEFEKACRGPIPPYYAYPDREDKAWGVDTAYAPNNYNGALTFSGAENGTEFFADYDADKRNYDPTFYSTIDGDGGQGPYRVGIYATNTSTRISSGASYYGIMDFSKITSEIVVPLGSARYREFNYSVNGKGVLSAFGNHSSFPNLTERVPETVNRFYSTSTRGGTNGFDGFRAVRLAPSDN